MNKKSPFKLEDLAVILCFSFIFGGFFYVVGFIAYLFLGLGLGIPDVPSIVLILTALTGLCIFMGREWWRQGKTLLAIALPLGLVGAVMAFLYG